MSNIVTIRPVAGRKVRKQSGQVLATEGEQVVWSSYWLRRQREGDIELVQAPAETDAQEAAPQESGQSARKPGSSKKESA